MPIDKSKYPANWKEISHQIRFERAKGRCEFCGVTHGKWGARDIHGTWWAAEDIDNLNSDYGYEIFNGDYPKLIRIILTTAHLGTPYADGSPCPKTNTMDCRPENLAALCQRCHLMYDLDQRLNSSYKTRMKKRIEAGNRILSNKFKNLIFGG